MHVGPPSSVHLEERFYKPVGFLDAVNFSKTPDRHFRRLPHWLRIEIGTCAKSVVSFFTSLKALVGAKILETVAQYADAAPMTS